MSQGLTSSRLSNSSVNINGATTAIKTNFGLAGIGVTGNAFDISSSSGSVTLGITGTGNVALGNATSGTVSFPGATTFSTLNSAAAGTDMSVGGNLTTGILALGSTASTANLYGTLAAKTISGPTAGSAMTIGSNITAGSVTIGNAASNNTVTIGNNGAGPTGTVNIGPSSAAVNVGTSQPGIVTVGVTGGTAWISGTVNIGATGGGNVNIGPNAGSVTNIGNNNAAATTVNVGNTGTSAFGTVNVGRGATAVFIGDNVASAITLGRTGGSVTLGPPLTLGAAPTTSGQLGGILTVTIPESVLTSGDWKNTPSFGLSAGVYLMNSTINTSAGNASTATYQSITYSISSAPNNGGSSYFFQLDSTQLLTEINGTGNTYGKRNFTRIFVIGTSSPTLYFSVLLVYTVGGSGTQPSILSSPVSFMRIA